MTAAPSPGRRLKDAVEREAQMVPGAFNALTARIAERSGFQALYISGAAISAGLVAVPDVGLVTLSEMAQQTRYISSAVTLPLIVDCDTGFGEVVNVERTVRIMEAAGAAAIQLEDQRLPKRCGHLSGKELIRSEEMTAKLRAAVAARKDPDFMVVARTDARGAGGFEEAVKRARLYTQAGADAIFPEALESAEEFSRFRSEVSGTLVANLTEFGKTPLLRFDELAVIGYSIALYPVTPFRLAMKAVSDGLEQLKRTGSQAGLLGRMQTRQELYDLLGYADYDRRDRTYLQP